LSGPPHQSALKAGPLSRGGIQYITPRSRNVLHGPLRRTVFPHPHPCSPSGETAHELSASPKSTHTAMGVPSTRRLCRLSGNSTAVKIGGRNKGSPERISPGLRVPYCEQPETKRVGSLCTTTSGCEQQPEVSRSEMSPSYGCGTSCAVNAAGVSMSVKAAGEVRATVVRSAAGRHGVKPATRSNYGTAERKKARRLIARLKNVVGWD